MSESSEVKKLREQRDAEAAALKAQMADLMHDWRDAPAEWVGDHPWGATLGAAAAGFTAAQMMFFRQRKSHKDEGRRRKRKGPSFDNFIDFSEHHHPRDGQRNAGFGITDLLELALSLAGPFLAGAAQGTAQKHAEEGEGYVLSGDAGTISAEEFSRVYAGNGHHN